MTNAPEMPACVEIEQAVLGLVLLSGDHFARIADVLDADDFSEEIHRQIFAVARSLAAEGRPPNVIMVRPHLGEHIGDMPTGQYLARLCAEAAAPAIVEQFARAIRDHADLRRLVELAQATAQRAASGATGLKPARLAADMIEEADRIAVRHANAGTRRVSLGEAGRAAFAEAVERKHGKPSRGVLTGLDSLDAMTGALEPGQGSILAGRPSMGKTAVAVQIGVNVARTGSGVLYVSLEMGASPLAQRVLSLVSAENGSPVPYSRIGKGLVNAADLAALNRASELVDPLPFEIEQQPGLTVSQIVAKARQVKQQFAARGVTLSLVVVDHLGLVKPSSRYSGNRVLEVGEISAALHALARELDVHVLMLSQLNRQVEARADKRPQLSDLRDSGDLEQNADLVIGCYREAYYLERSGNAEDAARALDVEHECELLVLKNRQGPTGTASLYVDMATNTVRSQEQQRRPARRPHIIPTYARKA